MVNHILEAFLLNQNIAANTLPYLFCPDMVIPPDSKVSLLCLYECPDISVDNLVKLRYTVLNQEKNAGKQVFICLIKVHWTKLSLFRCIIS